VTRRHVLKSARHRRDPLLWTIFGALGLLTLWARAELAEFFVVAGLLTLFVRTRPRGREAAVAVAAGLGELAIIVVTER
jgi:hypothetical protein